eukprot:TRINITY_DN1240_c4_g1_i1.p1 TRINITY_DN1240_c4_g1~~TRINITY_DN1240_c4_g1_i1.p1  ORF type:complete len:343 (-),score=162.44 TRINITY_DN1240_c4_g1_i1:118-1146(-)
MSKSKFENAIEREWEEIEKQEKRAINSVQIDALVVSKIVKHAKENFPQTVTGQLLGIDTQDKLEITNCFPFPPRESDEDNDNSTALAEYQMEMMRSLRAVNYETLAVGWYQTVYLGSGHELSLIQTQYNYQTTLKKSIVLTFDPSKSINGNLVLRAFRLTNAFLNAYKNQSFTTESLAKSGLNFNNITEELKLTIRKSQVYNACVSDLENSHGWSSLNTAFGALDLASGPYLEKNVESLVQCLDDLSSEQNKFQYYQRQLQRNHHLVDQYNKRIEENELRKLNGERPLPELEQPQLKIVTAPNRLDSLLITNQVAYHCQQMKRFSGQSFSKLHLLKQLNKTE